MGTSTESLGALRVCIVGPLPPPSGGMANQCEQLARLLAEERVSVEVVRSNPPYSPAIVGQLRGVRALFRLLPYLVSLWRAAGRADVMHVFANSGWAWHLFSTPAIWLAHLRAVPVIVNYRGGFAGSFFAAAPAHVFNTLRLAAQLVTPSAYLQRVFAQFDLDARIIPNIIDLSRFSACDRRDFGDSPHLVVTRNLEDIYDIPTAIRAFAHVRGRFPGARLTVAGTGPALASLRELVRSLGIEQVVSFAGRIDNARIPALYGSADCVLNPSTVDNMPISILEAYASAVPVVSTDAGGIPDIAQDGVSARLVGVGDHQAMGAAAVEVLSQPELARRLTGAGREEAARYAWHEVGPQWMQLYRELSRSRGAGAASSRGTSSDGGIAQ